MFGTDDVVYVPEGTQLVFDDVYRWRRFKIDVRRLGLRMRPGAFAEVSGKMRAALELCRHSPRFAETISQISVNAEIMVHDLAAISGAVEESLFGSVHDFFRNENVRWWVRIGDLPAESFFAEDYETSAISAAKSTPYLTFGRAQIAQLDGLDIELPGGEEEMPFSLDVPSDGLTRWTIPPHEPLPLVHEYCGVHGASAFGRTVNIDTIANVPGEHQVCTPIGRVGDKLFATLYLYYGTANTADIMGRLQGEDVLKCQSLLEQSGFQMVNSGPTWRIFDREGDVVHLYSGLAGKEAEGVETMPDFMLVASAGGQYDPQHRADLYEAIRETMRV